MTAAPWFAGAWRRRSIRVPGTGATEPCEAWWVQTGDLFVDVRVARPGCEGNGLPFSSTRVFAGRFELVDDGVRWHVELDSGGEVPRTDGAAGVHLHLADGSERVMIENAPGRFVEVWERPAAVAPTYGLSEPGLIAVEVGGISAAVWTGDLDAVAGAVWGSGWSLHVGDLAPPTVLNEWV